MAENEALETDIKKKAVERGKFEDLHKHDRLKKKGDRFYNNFQLYCMERLAYY